MDQRQKPRIRKPRVRYFDWRRFKPSMVLKREGQPYLVEELTTYRDMLPELLQHEGSYVVIKGKDYKILPDRDTALEYSLKNYWPDQALVMKIVAKQPYDSLGGAIRDAEPPDRRRSAGPADPGGPECRSVPGRFGPRRATALEDRPDRYRRDADRHQRCRASAVQPAASGWSHYQRPGQPEVVVMRYSVRLNFEGHLSKNPWFDLEVVVANPATPGVRLPDRHGRPVAVRRVLRGRERDNDPGLLSSRTAR